jgi:SAM-dependent methyltransferase
LSLVLDEHRQYLSDSVRLGAFRRAIQQVVRPGAVVVDLGSGTGILGLLACEAGARRVYAIEHTDIIEVARALAAANGYASRVTFIRALSTQTTLPERADVVIADQIGQFGFEAGLWEYFADARRRSLREGGVLIPASVSLFVAPLEAPGLFEQVEFWRARREALDISPAREWAVNTGYPAMLDAGGLLAAGACGATVRMLDASAEPFGFGVSSTIERAGVLHGIAGWFEAELAPGVTLTNSPCAAERIGRRNVYLPIDRAVRVEQGDRLRIDIRADPIEAMVTWSVEIVPRSGQPGVRFRHSTAKGMLISREGLRRSRPSFRPRLTPHGEARRTVLELCDGVRPLEEIERAVYERHRAIFRSAADASGFVAEVVTRYSE